MYLCIAPLSRFFYAETQRFINDFVIIKTKIFNKILSEMYLKVVCRNTRIDYKFHQTLKTFFNEDTITTNLTIFPPDYGCVYTHNTLYVHH